MPNANRLPVGIMAMVAEEERRMISKRTKDALAAAKRRGTKLGGDRGVVPSKKARAMGVEALRARADARAADLAPIIKELQAAGKTSLRAIAAGLNDAGDRIGADVELHPRLLGRHNSPRSRPALGDGRRCRDQPPSGKTTLRLTVISSIPAPRLGERSAALSAAHSAVSLGKYQ